MTPATQALRQPTTSIHSSVSRLDDTVICPAIGSAFKDVSESQRLIEAIFLNSPAIIYLKDCHGKYLLVNSQFESLFGLARGTAPGRTDFDFMPFDDAASLRVNDARVLATGRSIEFEETIARDGEQRTYLSLKFPIAGSLGDWVAVCGMSTDITARKQGQLYLDIQHGITAALSEACALDAAGPAILQLISEALGFDAGCLWELEAGEPRMRVVATWQTGNMPKPLTDNWGTRSVLDIDNNGVRHFNLDRQMASAISRDQQTGGHREEGSLWRFSITGGEKVLGAIELVSAAARKLNTPLRELLTSIGAQVGHFVEYWETEQALRDRKREFRIARNVQTELLPRESPVVPGFTIAGSCIPAQETGGDYFDYIPLLDGSLGIVVGDASGHGIGAALVIAQVRAYLRARILTDTCISTVLAHVNRQLAADLPGGHFVTLLFAKIDSHKKTISYASAGHRPGFILGADGEALARLTSTGFPLGIESGSDFPTLTLAPLQPHEFVVFMTDGIVEAIGPDDTQFGVERTLLAARSVRQSSPSAIVAAVLDAARIFSNCPAADDMTAVVIKADAAN